MLNPSRSGVNRPRIPSRLLNEPASQKKYTSQSASPTANRTLSPATDRRPWRIVASLVQIEGKLAGANSLAVIPGPERREGPRNPSPRCVIMESGLAPSAHPGMTAAGTTPVLHVAEMLPARRGPRPPTGLDLLCATGLFSA